MALFCRSVAIEAVTPRFSKVKLGDVVIANSPNNPTITVCKRVCGLVRSTLLAIPTPGSQHSESSGSPQLETAARTR